MKYIWIDKQDGTEEPIARETAIEVISKYYESPEEMLGKAEKSLGGQITTAFSIIEVRQ